MHILIANIEFTFAPQVGRGNDVAIKGKYIIFSHDWRLFY
jgi:hypothetical protein